MFLMFSVKIFFVARDREISFPVDPLGGRSVFAPGSGDIFYILTA